MKLYIYRVQTGPLTTRKNRGRTWLVADELGNVTGGHPRQSDAFFCWAMQWDGNSSESEVIRHPGVVSPEEAEQLIRERTIAHD